MAAVREPLAPETARTRRASLLHDELGRMPENHAVSSQGTMDDGLPEAVLVERLRPLEQRSFVGRVVSWQVGTLVSLERKHVPRIPAEVLGPVGRAQLLARIDPAADGVETAMELPDGLDPGQSGQHLTDRQHDDLAGCPIDALPPELGNESSRPFGKHGPGVTGGAAQPGFPPSRRRAPRRHLAAARVGRGRLQESTSVPRLPRPRRASPVPAPCVTL